MIGFIAYAQRIYRKLRVVATAPATAPHVAAVAAVVDIASVPRKHDEPDEADDIDWEKIDFLSFPNEAQTAAFLDWHYVSFYGAKDVPWPRLYKRYQVFCGAYRVRPISPGRLRLQLGPAGCTKRRAENENGKRVTVYNIVGRTHLVRRTA